MVAVGITLAAAGFAGTTPAKYDQFTREHYTFPSVH